MVTPSAALSRHNRMRSARRLLFILGDQLDLRMPALDEMDRERDAILMAEVREEAEHVPSHRQRTALFLSAMRHFALQLVERGFRVRYVRLDDRGNTHSFGSELKRAIDTLSPECVQLVQPGDHRVAKMLCETADRAGLPLQVREDTSFTCPVEEFEAWAGDGRKNLIMEYFYRERRRKLNVLVDKTGKPVKGKWNFDADNRQTFKRAPDVPRPYRARPDKVTREVIDLVERTWPEAPGRMDSFDWPVTREEALRALRDFVDHRLNRFGTYEDAMWAGEAVLYHSRLSSSMNLKLLYPHECVDAALQAYDEGQAAINNVEGFVRQIIGWREFIRGVYFHEGADYLGRNGLDQHGELPGFFWTAETEMNCLKHCLGEVVGNAWSHHIPRLMVIGNFALTAGVNPSAINDWFLAMYVDGVDWVTAPNVLGMSQHADHGVVGTKPYAASGKYIERMSNYCRDCPYDVRQRTGDQACPFNTFYWDFLIRNGKRFADNRRMALTLKNVDRLDKSDKSAIRSQARRRRQELGIGGISG
jgi:deoxyribodipyrimidine photolyase-related protein